MKTTGIRELKAHLSQFLRDVEQGEALLVTDRGRAVAEVRKPGSSGTITDAGALRHAELVQRGLIRPAPAPDDRSWADWEGLGAPKGSAQAILDADRGE